MFGARALASKITGFYAALLLWHDYTIHCDYDDRAVIVCGISEAEARGFRSCSTSLRRFGILPPTSPSCHVLSTTLADEPSLRPDEAI